MPLNVDSSNTCDPISEKLCKMKPTLNELMNEYKIYGLLFDSEDVRFLGADKKIFFKRSWAEINKLGKKKRRAVATDDKKSEENEVCEKEDWKKCKICVSSIVPIEIYMYKNNTNTASNPSHSASISSSSSNLSKNTNNSPDSSSDDTSYSDRSLSGYRSKKSASSNTSTGTPVGIDLKQNIYDKYSKPVDPPNIQVISSDDNESVKLSLSPITISSTSPLSSKSDDSLLYEMDKKSPVGCNLYRQQRREEMLNKLTTILSDAFKKKSKGKVTREISNISSSNIKEAAKSYCEMLVSWLRKIRTTKDPNIYGNFLLLLYKIGEFQIKNNCAAMMDEYLNNCQEATVLTRHRNFSRYAYMIWEPLNEQLLLNVEYFSPYWFDELNNERVLKWKYKLHEKIGI